MPFQNSPTDFGIPFSTRSQLQPDEDKIGKSRDKITPHENKTLSWWRTRKDKIDMNPPYQRRGRLWSAADKAYLIDSILNGFDVPKLYVADFTWGESQLNKKKLPYAIIDGKQRFEAIFDFFENKVTLNNDFAFTEDRSIKLGGLGCRDLQKNHPEIAEIFDNYNLYVMSVIASTSEPINELFVRLNRSKALTGAEVRNAMGGPAPDVIRQIAKCEFFETNVSFTMKRGQDLNAAAKILMWEFDGEMSETKKKYLDQFVLRTKVKSPQLELAGRRVLDILGTMNEVFLPNDILLGSAGVFPVYYWMIRNVPSKRLRFVREFLLEFEETRRENRTLADKTPKQKSDDELLSYDRLNRSTDDLRSHVGRYKILVDRFKRF